MMTTTMTPTQPITLASLARLVVLHCRLSGHEPDAGDVWRFLEAVQHRLEEQDAAGWAREYLAGCRCGGVRK